MTHGDTEQPIELSARGGGDTLEIAVVNAGDRIPDAAMDHLFEPFHREQVRPSQEGLGLGLYICAEIARAHGGTLDVRSDASSTRFVFRMGKG